MLSIKKINEEPSIICDLRASINHFFQKGLYLKKALDESQDLLLKEILSSYYTKCKELCENLYNYEAILFHKNIAHHQRMAYSNSRKNIEKIRTELLIELDFKQKFVIGMSPRQASSEYYEQKSRSCLG